MTFAEGEPILQKYGMTDETVSGPTMDELGDPTAPERFGVTARGFATEDEARQLANAIGECVRLFSRTFNLSGLDGVTVAHDYPQALLDLDRGYPANYMLTPSDGHAIGVAMTPSVLRDGALKSHIVFNAGLVTPILDPEHKYFDQALHIIAHECAHIEVTHKFDHAFPGILLRQQYADSRVALRWQVILACWDEYAATNLSANFGEDPTDGYEETLLKLMAEARDIANASIKAYRIHGRVDQVYAEVYGTYGELLKFAAYFLGNLDGQSINLFERRDFASKLSGHWFEPFFNRLHKACKNVARDYGNWKSQAVFEVIGDISDDLVALGGIATKYLPDGRLYLDIPFDPDTMPHA